MQTYLKNRDLALERLRLCLVQGISPRRLALTLSVGFVLGCIPLIGIPTGLCVLVALAFRLNQPAMQAANYAAMPFQIALVVPLMRLGSKLTPNLAQPGFDMSALMRSPMQLVTHSSSTQLMTQLGILAGQAMLGWVLLAVPVAVLLTVMLTGVLRRVPALAAVEARD
jgi:sorbitol-specific phosphotransferase system component IIC